MCLKVSSAKWRLFCLGLNMLRTMVYGMSEGTTFRIASRLRQLANMICMWLKYRCLSVGNVVATGVFWMNYRFFLLLILFANWIASFPFKSFLVFFTRGQFWPLGIVIACVCPCARQSWACLRDNSSQVWAWITKFGPKNAKYFAQGPCWFWDWLGLTFQVKFYFNEKFRLFASLLHLWNICETCLCNCSTSHMVPHTLSDYYMPTDRVTS